MQDTPTETKRDADYIGSRLQGIINLVRSCTNDLTRQGNKLFGHQPVSDAVKDISSEEIPVLDLLDYLDKETMELRMQVNRF